MKVYTVKWRCNDCGAIMTDCQVLRRKHPFGLDFYIFGCCFCKEINTLRQMCSMTQCNGEAVTGLHDHGIYTWVCEKHFKELTEKE